MQALRGTKDILPHEIMIWQHIYDTAKEILTLHNYSEIRTPIIENNELFERSIGNYTDIVNKEMYSFRDQNNRYLTLRPEGTASVARAFISNKLYLENKVNKLWYLGPMFRYERPQKGRQRQFHQLGIEYIGCEQPISDVEVIRLAIKILKRLRLTEYILEINSIGNTKERSQYTIKLKDYLNIYKHDLDVDSQNRLDTNPLRILDSKNQKTKEILINAPKLKQFLDKKSIKHFNEVCKHLSYLNIKYTINEQLVRGLDYYNYTAFELKTNEKSNQNTLCGGGRYDQLINQLGGPSTPSVGWAIGVERLLLAVKDQIKLKTIRNIIHILIPGNKIHLKVWDIIKILEEYKINFEVDLSGSNLNKQIKKAYISKAKICLIIGENELKDEYITIKWLETKIQQKIKFHQLRKYFKYIKKEIKT
uniref:Histidine--tRNA ligase, chloroplastic n=1 Tax=Cliftonaea pectinata TaxID=2007206 RepID=A0A1Z1MPJ4_9FLOR|nr:Histidine-tRNA ligase [Cliftonaea pectinata]ARW68010.1 Histidine-tRNA ligase [Cliftonaea pectinata]